MKRHDYRTALRAKGIRPIPPYDKLRTVKRPGDREMTSKGAIEVRS